MSEFKRPPAVKEDPEHCYRSGYQHGAQACFEALQKRLTPTDKDWLRTWIEIDLQRWWHDREANPRPPAIKSRSLGRSR
jgi:hypothetical protein